MKTIITSILLCFFLPITETAKKENHPKKDEFVVNFEKAFKHTIDNLSSLQNATVEEVVDDAMKASGQRGTVTILTIDQMIQQAESTKSSIPITNCFLQLLGNISNASSYPELIGAIFIYDQCLGHLGYTSDAPERQFVNTYKATLDLVNDELQYYKKGGEMSSDDSIPDWLRCLAGILAGAGTGFGVGGGYGTPAGPPGIGAGAIGGAIFGGIGGFAKFC
ncbi:MAG: hypothetical protein AAF598_20170 [Bacteroidota bacterium]